MFFITSGTCIPPPDFELSDLIETMEHGRDTVDTPRPCPFVDPLPDLSGVLFAAAVAHAHVPVSASRVSSASFRGYRGLLPPDRRTGHREIRILFLIRSECSDVSGECVSRARDRALTAFSLLLNAHAPRRAASRNIKRNMWLHFVLLYGRRSRLR